MVPPREGKPEIAGLYQELFAPGGPVEMVPVSREIILKSAEIRAHSSAKPIDAIHVATAVISGAGLFISDDRRLDSTPVPKITLEELLGE